MCFEDQKREMASIGSAASSSTATSSSMGESSMDSRESTPRGLYATYRNNQSNGNAISMNGNFLPHSQTSRMDNKQKSCTMPSISTTLKSHQGPVTIASTDIYFDSEPEEFEEDDNQAFHHHRRHGAAPAPAPPPLPPRQSRESNNNNFETTIINGKNGTLKNGNKKAAAPPPLPSKPKPSTITATTTTQPPRNHEKPPPPSSKISVNNRPTITRTNIHITPGTANCHNATAVSAK